jgi:hypothetical protein
MTSSTREAAAGTALGYQRVFLVGISINDYVVESEEAVVISAYWQGLFFSGESSPKREMKNENFKIKRSSPLRLH